MSTFELLKHAMPTPEPLREKILADSGFGKHFTDHMAHVRYTEELGWHGAQVEPYGPLVLDPAAAVLHYAQEIFEGLKAYRHADGSVWTFRPELNARRFNRSAARLALPELPEELFLESLKSLVSADSAWVPTPKDDNDEVSLYLRPFAFASEKFLGVRPSVEVDYYVIASPAQAYFSGTIGPVSIWVSQKVNRAAPGGTGFAKCGGNYAASLAAQKEAAEHGCAQVLFTDAAENRYLEELGGMNLFLVYEDGRLVTPALGDSILDGVTRRSLIELAEQLGYKPEERLVSLQEWKDGVASGEITEAFACGTAAVVTPIGTLKAPDFELQLGDEAGEVTMQLRSRLLDLQYGRVEDERGWLYRLA